MQKKKKREVTAAAAAAWPKEKRPDTIHNLCSQVEFSSVLTILFCMGHLHGFLFSFPLRTTTTTATTTQQEIFAISISAWSCNMQLPFSTLPHSNKTISGAGRKRASSNGGERATRLVANRISLFFQFISFPSHFCCSCCALFLCVRPFVFTNWIVRKEVCDFLLSTHTHRQTHSNVEQLWAVLKGHRPCKSA